MARRFEPRMTDEEADYLLDLLRCHGTGEIADRLRERLARPNAMCALCGHPVGRKPMSDPGSRDGLVCDEDCKAARERIMLENHERRMAAKRR